MSGVTCCLLIGMPPGLTALASTGAAGGAYTTPAAPGPAAPGADAAYSPANARGQYRYLIRFNEPGLLRATPGRDSGDRPDLRIPSSIDRRDALVARQAGHRQRMQQRLGRALEVTHHYLVTRSGLATWLTEAEADIVAGLPEVAEIQREAVYELATHAGPWFIGADTLWDGSNSPDHNGLRGEGMVIAVLDTGVDPSHPSFINDLACGHGQGGQSDKLLSALDCGATDTGGLCNGPNPVDSHGHGSHVASTAAGNRLDATAQPPPQPPAPYGEVSGVAPCAHIRSYKVCPADGCPGAAILAGLESVFLHGDVDVVNYSLSGGINPWNDLERPKLDLVDTGVLVAAASGNTSSGAPVPTAQVNHRGPWVLSVAASSHDGSGTSGLLSIAGPGTPPQQTQNIAARGGSASPAAAELTDLPLRHFDQQPADWEGCTPGADDGSGNGPAPGAMPAFPDGFFAGAAALIQRGGCSFVSKISNAFDAGAELVIIRNNQPDAFNMGTPGQPDVPAYLVDLTPGAALQAFVAAHPGTATIDFQPVAGDVLANFSFRGPTPPPLHNLTKPDITAPGTAVYAAIPLSVEPAGFAFMNGTSMASPHVAGAAALLRQAHPDWSVPEVMSALMTTAHNPGRRENLVDSWSPDDVGSGRADLTRAALAGLVFDESYANYLAADPATGGDVRTLNTPSLRDMDCRGSCTFTRTVRNTLNTPTEWEAAGLFPPSSEGGPGGMPSVSEADAHATLIEPHSSGTEPRPTGSVTGEPPPFEITIEPQTFTFTGDPSETQELTITITPLENNLAGAIAFGHVQFTETAKQAPDQHLTVAIRGRPVQPVIALDPINLEADLPNTGTTIEILTIANMGEEPLAWQITETMALTQTADLQPAGRHHSGYPAVTASTINCDQEAGILINDTGMASSSYSGQAGHPVMYVDHFVPQITPATITSACFAFASALGTPPTLDFEIVVFAADGPDGAPGTELGTLPVTFQDLPAYSTVPQWAAFDLSSMEITIETASFYLGARWQASSPNVWLLADESPVNPPGHAGGWLWLGEHDLWLKTQQLRPNYRAMFIRPVTELADLDCTLPDWLAITDPAGMLQPGGEQSLDVTFDAAGLEGGTYTAYLCLATNDPGRSLAVVPLVMTVIDVDRVFRDRFQ